MATDQYLIDTLVEEFADNEIELFEMAMNDLQAPGICVVDGCEFTTLVDQDTDDGFCDECGNQSVKSCLIIAGMI